MRDDRLFLGLDLGTSGARAVVIDAQGQSLSTAKAALADFGANSRMPAVWLAAAEAAIDAALASVDRGRVAALSVDGTSGTMLALDAASAPIGDALMYNDTSSDRAALEAIARFAPATSAAHGATSGLAKAAELRARGAERIAHQADWIAARLSGRIVTDENNALKTGYDPIDRRWPDWIAAIGFDLALLPEVKAPGDAIGRVTAEAVARFGLSPDALVVAGTTDGCASFLATGASDPGEGVTALGTTLTLKLMSDRPVFAPEYGVYSHRLLGRWLAGGASNTGGGALLAHFSAAEIVDLSARLNPDVPTGLDYYPLPRPGERFPIADPALPPRITPQPDDPARFLQGLLEGIAAIEALGYRRLVELGAPALKSMRSVGGGARNAAWTAIRARNLGVPLVAALDDEAAYGAALLARAGA
jgi:sugar (pentulose or hexulose) kinase